MSVYKHGIATKRSTDAQPAVRQTASSVQVAVGTAPVNLAENPTGVTNKVVVCESISDFKKKFGWSDDFASYTLCEVAYEAFKKDAVSPVVFINVLDPTKATHKEAVAAASMSIVGGMIKIAVKGILLSSIAVTDATAGTDYVASFDDEGNAIIAVVAGGALDGAASATVAYTKLLPSGVTNAEVIGGIDASNVRTGIELIDEIYSTFGIVPGVLLAPGYSHNAAVAFALEAKAELAGSLTNAIAVCDIESTTTTTLAAVETAKNTLGAVTRWSVLCWPMCKVDGKVMHLSTVVAGRLQKIAAENSNIPGESPSNLDVQIDALCLASGTEVIYTIDQVNDYLNAKGVISAIYVSGWKLWGNNTAAYPGNTNPNDRFIKNVMMSNYIENRFKTEYLSKVDRNASPKSIQAIVTDYNMTLNALTPGYLAGGEIVFDKERSDFYNGHIYFITRYADYTPMEYIENSFIWDLNTLLAAIEEV